jgi:WD repeat-containing protein 76
MNRRAEIFSADGTLLRALYDEDYITAVPAVTAMHPVRPGRLATGNASGRANLWA